jgi:hypothetical protein
MHSTQEEETSLNVYLGVYVCMPTVLRPLGLLCPLMYIYMGSQNCFEDIAKVRFAIRSPSHQALTLLSSYMLWYALI